MSDENVQLLRGVYGAPGDRGFDALLEIASDDIAFLDRESALEAAGLSE